MQRYIQPTNGPRSSNIIADGIKLLSLLNNREEMTTVDFLIDLKKINSTRDDYTALLMLNRIIQKAK